MDSDNKNYRLAFIDAFKRRGIYPKGIKTLSVESLKYPEVSVDNPKSVQVINVIAKFLKGYGRIMKFRGDREKIFTLTKVHIAGNTGDKGLHEKMYDKIQMNEEFEKLVGIIANQSYEKHGINEGSYTKEGEEKKPTFKITNLREISRVGPTGKKVDQIKFSVVQTARIVKKANGKFTAKKKEDEYLKFRGGSTLIFDLNSGSLKYSISKPIFDAQNHEELNSTRLTRQYNYQFDEEMNGMSELEKYFNLKRNSEFQEPFALLHNH